MNDLQTIVTKQGLTGDGAQTLMKEFGAPFTEVGEILATYKDIVVTSEDDIDGMKKARETRLELKRVRTAVENKRKELKEDSLRTGKAIDGVAKFIKDNIQPAEQYLETQEKYAEVKEAERLLKLKLERIEKITPYCDFPHQYEVENMTDERFEKLVGELKTEHDLKVKQAEAYERQLEQERAEKESEDKRIREENEILKKQAAEREAEITKEREMNEAAQQAHVTAARSEATQKVLDRVKNAVNALERREVDGSQVISHAQVIGILDNF